MSIKPLSQLDVELAAKELKKRLAAKVKDPRELKAVQDQVTADYAAFAKRLPKSKQEADGSGSQIRRSRRGKA